MRSRLWIAAAILPLAGVQIVSFPLALAALITSFLILGGGQFIGSGVRPPLLALWFLLAWLPSIEWLAPPSWAFLIPGTAILLFSHLVADRSGKGIRPGDLLSADVLACLVPVGLGSGILLAFSLSPIDLPSSFIPWEGLLVPAGLSLIWWSLLREFSREPKFQALVPWTAAAVSALLVLSVGARALWVHSEGRALRENASASSQAWVEWVGRAEALEFPPLESRARSLALASPAVVAAPLDWVALAKGGSDEDIAEAAPSLFWRFMAFGGQLFDGEHGLQGEDRAAALCVDLTGERLYALSASGRLVRIADHREEFPFSPQVGPFVHARLDSEGNPLLLEAGGSLRRFRNLTLEEVCPSRYGAEAPILRRLCIDPVSGAPWALDLYGNLYRNPSPEGWTLDARFVEVCRRGTIDVDVAQDIAIDHSGTIALLACDGEIWSSSLEGGELKGPIRDCHYFPDFPVAQSLGAGPSGFHLADRYGGFFHSPYPSDRDSLRFKGTHLFPRSLPVREKAVLQGEGIVDHHYLAGHRWLCLLTGKGRVLTNRRWSEIWAL